MLIQMATVSRNPSHILTDTAFWNSQIPSNVASILFEAPVMEGLQYLSKWLKHQALTLADVYDQLPSARFMGMSLAFNMARGFADQPALLLVYFAEPPTMLVLSHHLDQSFLHLLDAMVGAISTYFIVSGEPEATLLTAYLRLTDRKQGFPDPPALALDIVYVRMHQEWWE